MISIPSYFAPAKVLEILLTFFLLASLPASAKMLHAHQIEEVYELIGTLSSGDTLLIHPGHYPLTHPVVIDGNFSPNGLCVLAHDTQWDGKSLPFLLDLRGDHITWHGGEYIGGSQSAIEIRGNHIEVGYAEIHGGKDPAVHPCGIALIGSHHSIHHCEIYAFGNIGIDGNGGEVGEDKNILRLNHDQPYRSLQDWHIYCNYIHDIEVQNYGIHEGAMKLVPMVRGVYIYDNLIEDCQGQGIWLDRPEGDVLIFQNEIRNIEGKGIFYEISDEYEGSFGVFIVRNRVTNTGKQPIWISASNHATVIGNYAQGTLPSGAGSMPREIGKQNGVPGTGRDMTLTNNHFAYNVFLPTASKNHLVVYDYSSQTDPNASDNTFSHNYYVTGQEATIQGRTFLVDLPAFSLGTSRSIARNSTTKGLQPDGQGQHGPDPKGFYFSDEDIGLQSYLDKFPMVLENIRE